MAEQHTAVSNSTATWQFFLQQIWNFVENTQSGILQFAQDADGTTYGIRSGGALKTSTSGLGSGFGTDGDYIVIEPVNAYPGGGKWQLKIYSGDVSVNHDEDCTWEISWLGGWQKSDGSFGSNQTTAAKEFFSATQTTTDDTWYISCSNSDTYDNSSGTQTYTYFRVLLYDNNGTEGATSTKYDGGYVGGYIPVEPDDDSKPVVCFFGKDIAAGTTTTNCWGDADSTNNGLAPGNYAHDTGGGNISAFINGASNVYTGYGNTRSGNWANGPTLILDYTNNTTLGAFGKFTQMKGNADRSDGATDASVDYRVVGDQVIRWNPD
mgnify:FL=1|tara:strand:+ start:1020 stop:1985 length:966 start_codon:yes stop_codon:yes gene_type:complete